MRSNWRTAAVAVWLVVLVAGVWAGAASAAPGRPPKLVVVLVVDQMRGDYIDRYAHQWTGGLHRLLSGGAWFSRAAYPYFTTVTCVGHATISTGALPWTHGIVGNGWIDRATGGVARCVEDPAMTAVSYGDPVTGGASAYRLLVPTLADELRAQLPGPTRVATFSMKARTAVMLAGHDGDAVTFFNPAAKGFVTSTPYAKAPVPFVQAYVKAHPIAAEYGKAWTRMLPADRYLFQDAGQGEKPASDFGWTTEFPHVLKSQSGQPDATFYTAWETSPLSDAYLGQLGIAAVDGLKLGQGRGTDFLGISFSALDLVGHDFGPTSHEVQDVLARLDQTVGGLLAHLDRSVGAGNYVVALTADHGVAMVPEQMAAKGLDAGRLQAKGVRDAIQQALTQVLGPGTYTVRQSNSDFYLDAAAVDRLRRDALARDEIVRVVEKVRGVAAVYFGDHLDSHAAAGDRIARAALLNWVPGRSGDLIVLPRPNWIYVEADGTPEPGDATSHGTPYAYDQHVPVVLYGAAIRRGEYLRAVCPVDIAPTLAFLAGVTLAHADGSVLIEAIAPRALEPSAGATPATVPGAPKR
jgi:hypothetical protein